MRQVGSEYVADVPIGQGSTGQVWRGSVVATGAPVAIKLLDPTLVQDRATVARFVQERSILTGLRSAHLVRVHDLVAERDTLAIVMDLVPGIDLRHHLQRVGSLAPALAAELVGQVLGALSVVHRAGIVHRDVKPENVLLDLTDAERPRALLTDFGIARIVRDPADARPGGLAGTLRYLAPEVARSGEASAASDLYSAGVVLYELLAGRPPFEATEPFGLLRAHELQEPAPIPGLPAGMQAVLGLLLAKRPGDRPASATSARQLLAAAAVEVRGMSAPPRLGDADLYHGPTIPPGVHDTLADPHWTAPLEGSPTVLLANSASGRPGPGSPRPASGSAESGLATLGTLLLSDETGGVPSPRGGGAGPAGAVGYAGGPPEEPRDGGRRGIIGLGLLALLTIGLILAVIAFWNSGAGGPDPTTTPGLALTTPSPTAPSTPVISVPAVVATVSPTPSAPSSATPTATSSATPTPGATRTADPTVTVPDVVGLSRATAVAQLEGVGITRVSVSSGCFTGRQAGRVVRQAPAAGSTVASKQASIVVQSSQCLSVPSVIGDNVAQAVRRLRQAGFTDISQTGGGFGQKRRVTGQTPVPGSSVAPGTAILLTVSATRTG